jgi:hypothetical protein
MDMTASYGAILLQERQRRAQAAEADAETEAESGMPIPDGQTMEFTAAHGGIVSEAEPTAPKDQAAPEAASVAHLVAATPSSPHGPMQTLSRPEGFTMDLTGVHGALLSAATPSRSEGGATMDLTNVHGTILTKAAKSPGADAGEQEAPQPQPAALPAIPAPLGRRGERSESLRRPRCLLRSANYNSPPRE